MRQLEIVTRHIVGRPTMLEKNMASVRAMDGNWRQALLPDEDNRGVAWANGQMRTYTPTGDYVWMLDDDDEAACTHLPKCIDVLTDLYEPDLIMVRMNHGERLGVLPTDEDWQKRNSPREGGIGCSAFVVSRKHWLQCRHAWGERYEGDYDFVSHAFAEARDICWHNCIASRCQRALSGGRPE